MNTPKPEPVIRPMVPERHEDVLRRLREAIDQPKESTP